MAQAADCRADAPSRCPPRRCAPATSCLCEAGDLIPGDGEVIEGVATVDESVITGESAPVIRESGGDRSAVTGGTRVLSDWIKIRITSNPGETFLDRMIALVEGAQRQKTPNEIALNILIAGLTLIFLLAVVTLQPFAALQRRGSRARAPCRRVAVLVSLLVCLIPTTIGGLLSAIGIAGMDRVMQHNVLAMSGKAVEASGDVQHAAARQDRHDHAGQSAGGGVHSAERASTVPSWPMRRSCRAWPTRRPKAARSSCSPRRSIGLRGRDVSDTSRDVHPVLGLHAHERRRPRRPRSCARARPTRSRQFVKEQRRRRAGRIHGDRPTGSRARGGTPLAVARRHARCSASFT